MNTQNILEMKVILFISISFTATVRKHCGSFIFLEVY